MLIDAYGRAGSPEDAERIFLKVKISDRDIATYGSIIHSYALVFICFELFRIKIGIECRREESNRNGQRDDKIRG